MSDLLDDLGAAAAEVFPERLPGVAVADVLADARERLAAIEAPTFEHDLSRELAALGPPTLALYRAILEVTDRDAALAAVRAILARRYDRMPFAWLRKAGATAMFQTGAIRPLFRRKIEANSEPGGFELAEVDPKPGDVLAFEVRGCPLARLVAAEGVPELGPLFCELDTLVVRWAAGIELERHGTIAAGAPVCDFRFHRGRPRES